MNVFGYSFVQIFLFELFRYSFVSKFSRMSHSGLNSLTFQFRWKIWMYSLIVCVYQTWEERVQTSKKNVFWSITKQTIGSLLLLYSLPASHILMLQLSIDPPSPPPSPSALAVLYYNYYPAMLSVIWDTVSLSRKPFILQPNV